MTTCIQHGVRGIECGPDCDRMTRDYFTPDEQAAAVGTVPTTEEP